MQVKYLWPQCPIGLVEDEFSWSCLHRNSFWVLASEDEAKTLIVPRLKEHELIHWNAYAIPENIAKSDYDMYFRDVIGNVYFLIADDLSRIALMQPVYPVSGMWGGYSPFKKFERSISSLEDLRNLL